MIKIDLLKEKMEDKGYSINALSKASKVDKAVISRLLNDKDYNCSVGTAQKIAKALELTNKESVLIFLS